MNQHTYTGIAKLFMNGRSQAVRLPAECRFDADEVVIQKIGDNVVLSSKSDSWDAFFAKAPIPEDEQIPMIVELPFEDRESL